MMARPTLARLGHDGSAHLGIPVEVQLYKAEVGPTSGPTWRLAHFSVLAKEGVRLAGAGLAVAKDGAFQAIDEVQNLPPRHRLDEHFIFPQ
jgi:hypothetical protein